MLTKEKHSDEDVELEGYHGMHHWEDLVLFWSISPDGTYNTKKPTKRELDNYLKEARRKYPNTHLEVLDVQFYKDKASIYWGLDTVRLYPLDRKDFGYVDN